MNSFNKDIGKLGEDLTEQYLKDLGYIILQRNFSCKIGEVDLIGKDGSNIVFIEVKTRYNNIHGNPSESVTSYKQAKIIRTAQFYIMIKQLYKFNFRFDVVEVFLARDGSRPRIRVIKNAFQL